MSIRVTFHVNSNYERLSVASGLQRLNDGEKSAYVRLNTGTSSLTMFFDSIEDMEKLSFEVSTLVMAARDEWGMDSERGKEST